MYPKHAESNAISEQIKQFLAAGNPIQKIPNGVGKDSHIPTERSEPPKRRKDSSRWHGPSTDSKSRRWNDGKQGAL